MSRRILIITAAVFVTLIIVVVVLVLQANKNKVNYREYYDPASKQTVSDPVGKSPETFGQDNRQPVFLGLNAFLDHGMSDTQFDGLKSSLTSYARANHVSELSIYVDSVTKIPYDKNSPDPKLIYKFDIRINRSAKQSATTESSGLDDIRLVIKNEQDKQVFDSGVVNLKGYEGD